jgi:hypothetical protein
MEPFIGEIGQAASKLKSSHGAVVNSIECFIADLEPAAMQATHPIMREHKGKKPDQ